MTYVKEKSLAFSLITYLSEKTIRNSKSERDNWLNTNCTNIDFDLLSKDKLLSMTAKIALVALSYTIFGAAQEIVNMDFNLSLVFLDKHDKKSTHPLTKAFQDSGGACISH